MGTIFAHDAKQHQKWIQSRGSRRKRGLVGADLESAVMRIAAMFPNNVVQGGAA